MTVERIRRDLFMIAGELHSAMQRESADIIVIGNLLIEARDQLDLGEWLPWLEENFGSSRSTAYNYISAAELVRRFPTVGNLKLRPGALYALGEWLDDDFLNEKAIPAVLKEAETKWVTAEKAREIAQSIWEARDREDEERDEEAEEQAEDHEAESEEEEIEDILDGPPPELPPAPEAAAPDVILPSFDQAVSTLARLQTKPLSKFTGAVRDARELRDVAQFLLDVADAIEAKQPKERAA